MKSLFIALTILFCSCQHHEVPDSKNLEEGSVVVQVVYTDGTIDQFDVEVKDGDNLFLTKEGCVCHHEGGLARTYICCGIKRFEVIKN